MLKTEKIKRQIDVMPEDMLDEVTRFIRKLKVRKQKPVTKSPLLSDLAAIASDMDLPEDLSEQHDHYLYGLPKK